MNAADTSYYTRGMTTMMTPVSSVFFSLLPFGRGIVASRRLGRSLVDSVESRVLV